MPVYPTTDKGDIDYVAVARKLQSMTPRRRKQARTFLEAMSDKRKNYVILLASGLVFAAVMYAAAVQGVEVTAAVAIALSSGLLAALLVLVVLRLL